MLLDDAIAQFLADRTLKRRSAATIARYRAALMTAWHRWRHARQHPPTLTDLTLARLRQYLLYPLAGARAARRQPAGRRSRASASQCECRSQQPGIIRALLLL